MSAISIVLCKEGVMQSGKSVDSGIDTNKSITQELVLKAADNLVKTENFRMKWYQFIKLCIERDAMEQQRRSNQYLM